MGHEWVTCFRNPASEYGKRTEAASIHQIQRQSTTIPVSIDTRRNSRIGTPVQRYPCNVCGSLDHPGHRCPLLLDDDVKNAIQKKLPQTAGSSVVITDVHTVDISHVGPRTRSQTHRQDPAVPKNDKRTTEVPRPTDAFDWQAEEKLREEMMQTVRDLQDLSPLEPATPPVPRTNPGSDIEICNNILQQIESQTIQVSLKNLMAIAPSITDHIHCRLGQKATSFVLVPETSTVAVHSVVAIDRHMPIISAKIGNHELHDVLLDGGSRVNVITETERRRLGLPNPTPAPFKLRMADSSLVQPTGLLRDVKIYIHGIPYIIILTVISCKDVNFAYTILLGRPWLRDARVIHDWANDHIQIMGNGTVRTVRINRKLGFEATTPDALVCYNYVEGLTDEEEVILLEAEEFLHPIGTLAIDDICQVSTTDLSFPSYQ